MVSPGVGLVCQAHKQAAGLKQEDEQAEAFFSSLLTIAVKRPELGEQDVRILSGQQRRQLCRALAVSLGCEAGFDEEAASQDPALSLLRAHRRQWENVFAQVREAFVLPTLTPSIDFAGLATITKLVPEISSLVDRLVEPAVSFKAINRMIDAMSKPPAELFLATLRMGGIDSPILYPPTSVWREEPLPAEVESVEPQQQRWSQAYEMIMHVETGLRKLIEESLSARHGEKWWKRGVPESVRGECESRKAEKESEDEAGYPPLTYAYIDELRQILLRKDNWESCFKPRFPKLHEAEAWMNTVSKYRQPTMHFRPLDEDDSLFLTAACRWFQLRLSAR
jgi:hypothetical protein